MNLEFDDLCWAPQNGVEWLEDLVDLLVLVKRQQQHHVLAAPPTMLAWCAQHLKTHTDYFKTRLSQAQPRANALTIRISPTGAPAATTSPPWVLNARAAADIVYHPLSLFLENDESDRRFLSSTISSFARWEAAGWIKTEMGGGSALKSKIESAAADPVRSWRNFFMFDSDRLHPSEFSAGWTPPRRDSCQGYQFEVACANLPATRWHRLKRRSIENYLPGAVLTPKKPDTTSVLFSSNVGMMAHYYNMKEGLAGDGVYPQLPKKAVRAARSQSLWTALTSVEITALKDGFGKDISDEFSNVPPNHPWPVDVVSETDALADAIQDAM